MQQDRLLKRLRIIEKGQVARGENDKDKIIAGILSYLQRILNTRQGSVPIAEDFGVPDFSSLASRFSTENTESIEDIETALRNVIQKYEPRLSVLKVSFTNKDDNNLNLKFQVSAEIVTENERTSIVINTLMSPEGEMKVSTGE